MAWRLEGTFLENCNCDMVCPCTTSAGTVLADYDRCLVLQAFHVTNGEIEGVDVSGTSVVILRDTPPLMSEGNWRSGLIIDADASQEQADALQRVFSGAGRRALRSCATTGGRGSGSGARADRLRR